MILDGGFALSWNKCYNYSRRGRGLASAALKKVTWPQWQLPFSRTSSLMVRFLKGNGWMQLLEEETRVGLTSYVLMSQ